MRQPFCVDVETGPYLLRMLKQQLQRPEVFLYLLAAAVPLCFACWQALINNFSIEQAGFTGIEIGMLQSLREVPGFLAFAVVFLLLVVVFSFGLFNDPRELPSPFLGEQAPTFEVASLKEPERLVGSAEYAGQMALVNVWATWCVGCRQEHELLLQIAAASVGDQPHGAIGLVG